MPITSSSAARVHLPRPASVHERRRWAQHTAMITLGIALAVTGVLGIATDIEQPMWMYGRAIHVARIESKANTPPTYAGRAAPGERIELWCSEPGFGEWHVGSVRPEEVSGRFTLMTDDCRGGTLEAYAPYLDRPIERHDVVGLGIPFAFLIAVLAWVASRARLLRLSLETPYVARFALALGGAAWCADIVTSTWTAAFAVLAVLVAVLALVAVRLRRRLARQS